MKQLLSLTTVDNIKYREIEDDEDHKKEISSSSISFYFKIYQNE